MISGKSKLATVDAAVTIPLTDRVEGIDHSPFEGVKVYAYDPANRLTAINSQTVTWDDNGREAPLRRRSWPPKRGNMLNDGTTTYSYNSANKLTGVTQGTSTIVYAYSGLGDRLQQIADGVTTVYTLDINTSLTQVLQDGNQTYLYGPSTGSGQANRIAQVAETQTGYFLPDALGSMRQMTDTSTALTLTRAFDPYGNVVSSSGAGETVYDYTGEMQANGLVHLRARDYASQLGRFTSRDTWEVNYSRPLSLNKWMYVEGNPIQNTDHSGNVMDCDHTHPDTCLIPDVISYDEKKYPSNAITFSGNEVKYPEIFYYRNDKNKTYEEKLVKPGTLQAQFIPQAYESWPREEGKYVHTGLCGQISIAAIVNMSANKVVDYFVGFRKGYAPDYTGSNELKDFIDEYFEEEWRTWDKQFAKDWGGIDDIPQKLPIEEW